MSDPKETAGATPAHSAVCSRPDRVRLLETCENCGCVSADMTDAHDALVAEVGELRERLAVTARVYHNATHNGDFDSCVLSVCEDDRAALARSGRPDAQECSICRGRHGREIEHASE